MLASGGAAAEPAAGLAADWRVADRLYLPALLLPVLLMRCGGRGLSSSGLWAKKQMRRVQLGPTLHISVRYLWQRLQVFEALRPGVITCCACKTVSRFRQVMYLTAAWEGTLVSQLPTTSSGALGRQVLDHTCLCTFGICLDRQPGFLAA